MSVFFLIFLAHVGVLTGYAVVWADVGERKKELVRFVKLLCEQTIVWRQEQDSRKHTLSNSGACHICREETPKGAA